MSASSPEETSSKHWLTSCGKRLVLVTKPGADNECALSCPYGAQSNLTTWSDTNNRAMDVEMAIQVSRSTSLCTEIEQQNFILGKRGELEKAFFKASKGFKGEDFTGL